MRGEEDWKREILTLPEARFFNLMKNYVGEISTPFDKHKLIRRLSSFLRKREIQDRIIGLMGHEEARLITAICLLENPTLAALRALLEDDFSILALNDAITNLEDRLCVYRLSIDDIPRIALTPHLEERLRDEVVDSRFLVSGSSCEPTRGTLWLADDSLLALYCYLCEQGWPLRKDRSLRKRDKQQLAQIFVVGPPSEGVFQQLARILTRMGMLTADVEIESAGWQQVANGDPASRRLRMLAATYHAGTADLVPLSSFFLSLSGCLYDRQTLRRVWRLVHLRSGRAEVSADLPLDTFVLLGALVPVGDGYTVNAELIDPAYLLERGTAIPHSNFEITLTRGVTLEAALPLANASEVRRQDATLLLEITRQSYQGYLDRGGSTDALVRAMGALNCPELPQNVLFSIRSWEREYRRLALYDGVVLVTDEEHSYLLDNSPSLAPYIEKKLGAGVYLLDREKEALWREALRKAGVEHVPEISAAPESEHPPELPFEVSEARVALPALAKPLDLSTNGSQAPVLPLENGDSIRDDLLSRLRAMDLSDQEAVEIETRIQKGLILTPDQLRPLRSRGEKDEARGLDYLGKIRVLERAIGDSALVEIVSRGPSGRPVRQTVRPVALEKGGSNLHLRAETADEGTDLRLKVSRISLVRRVYSSLLE